MLWLSLAEPIGGRGHSCRPHHRWPLRFIDTLCTRAPPEGVNVPPGSHLQTEGGRDLGFNQIRESANTGTFPGAIQAPRNVLVCTKPNSKKGLGQEREITPGPYAHPFPPCPTCKMIYRDIQSSLLALIIMASNRLKQVLSRPGGRGSGMIWEHYLSTPPFLTHILFK